VVIWGVSKKMAHHQLCFFCVRKAAWKDMHNKQHQKKQLKNKTFIKLFGNFI
jgi:hypothetical protein